MSTPPITDQDSSALAGGEVALPTDEQVSDYMADKLRILQELNGYAQLTVSISGFPGTVRNAEFRIASGPALLTAEAASFEDACERLREKINAHPPVEQLRNRAAELMAEADALEAKGGES